jgi:hypothetical protein
LKGDRVFKKTAPMYPELQEKINTAISSLNDDPDSPEYARTVDQIVKLDEVLNGKKPKKTFISKDTIVLGFVNLLGILFVIHAETTGAITSKGFSLLKKV